MPPPPDALRQTVPKLQTGTAECSSAACVSLRGLLTHLTWRMWESSSVRCPRRSVCCCVDRPSLEMAQTRASMTESSSRSSLLRLSSSSAVWGELVQRSAGGGQQRAQHSHTGLSFSAAGGILPRGPSRRTASEPSQVKDQWVIKRSTTCSKAKQRKQELPRTENVLLLFHSEKKNQYEVLSHRYTAQLRGKCLKVVD